MKFCGMWIGSTIKINRDYSAPHPRWIGQHYKFSGRALHQRRIPSQWPDELESTLPEITFQLIIQYSGKYHYFLHTSLNWMILGCLRDRWLMISLWTFSSIWGFEGMSVERRNWDWKRRGLFVIGVLLAFFPLSMYLTARSSLVFLCLTSLATPKFPDPNSLSNS